MQLPIDLKGLKVLAASPPKEVRKDAEGSLFTFKAFVADGADGEVVTIQTRDQTAITPGQEIVVETLVCRASVTLEATGVRVAGASPKTVSAA